MGEPIDEIAKYVSVTEFVGNFISNLKHEEIKRKVLADYDNGFKVLAPSLFVDYYLDKIEDPMVRDGILKKLREGKSMDEIAKFITTSDIVNKLVKRLDHVKIRNKLLASGEKEIENLEKYLFVDYYLGKVESEELKKEIEKRVDKEPLDEIARYISVIEFVGKFLKNFKYEEIRKRVLENPDKTFIPAYEDAVCPNMKLNTLERLYLALKNEQYVVSVPKAVAEKARRALENMFTLLSR